MSYKHVLSLSLLAVILQSCGDTQDEKKLKRRNDELLAQNNELRIEKNATAVERDAAASNLAMTQQDLESAKKDKSFAEKARSEIEKILAAKEQTIAEADLLIKAKNNLIAAKEEEITLLRNAAAPNTAEAAALAEKLKDAEAQVQTLTAELTQAKADRDAAQSALEAAKTEMATRLGEKDAVIAAKDVEITNLKAAAANPETAEALAKALAEISALKGERDALQTKLTEAVKQAEVAAAKAKADYEEQLRAKDQVLAQKEEEINVLKKKLEAMSGSADIEALRSEITKLKAERDALKTSMEKAEADKAAAVKDLDAAKASLKDVEGRLTSIYSNSLAIVKGLWLDQVQVNGSTMAKCYEFAHVDADGTFTRAIACRDGRVQMQKHAVDGFSVPDVPASSGSDYEANYGFGIQGKVTSSTCQNPADSMMKAGNRLVFEMTQQAFGDDHGSLVSRNMVVTDGASYKGFTNAVLNLQSGASNYDVLVRNASAANAGSLTKAAAAFVVALQGRGAGATVGCFDSNGVFTATSSN